MAGRVNTKFVIGLLAVVIVVSVGIAAWYVLAIRRDPGRYITQANAILAQAETFVDQSRELQARSAQLRAQAHEAMLKNDLAQAQSLSDQSKELDAQVRELLAEADYERAAALLRRAYGYEKNSEDRIKIITRLAEVYGQTPPKNMEEARTLVLSVEQCWARILQLNPQHVQAAEQLLVMNYERAELFPQLIQLWNQLFTRASDVLAFAPQNKTAQRYRGVALVNRIEALNLGADEIATAREDLIASLQADPDDSLVAYYLSSLDLIEAQEYRRINQNAKADALIKSASERLELFVKNHPDDIDARLRRFRFTLRTAAGSGDADWQNKAIADLRAMAKPLALSGNVQVTREVAGLLIDLDQEMIQLDDGTQVQSGLHLAEGLLNRLVRQDPADVVSWTTLGLLYRRQGQIDRAIAVLEEARLDRPLPVSTEAFRAADFRVAAMRELADIHIGLYEQRRASGDSAGAKDAWNKAEAQAAAIEELRGDKHALTLMTRGKLALAGGDAMKAVKYLYDANVQFDGQQHEVLLLLAQAYQRTGETGAAADAYQKLLATPRGARIPIAYLQLARLKLRTGDTTAAMELIDRLLKLTPDNAAAIVLKSAALLQSAGPDATAQAKAIKQSREMLEPLVQSGDRSATIQMALTYRAQGNLTEARALLEKLYDATPTDATLLQQIVALDQQLGQTDQALARVQAAMERDADNRMYPLLLAALKGQNIGDMTDQLAEAMTDQDDPVLHQLSLWQLYMQAGKTEEANEAMEQARKMGPEHPEVLKTLFDQALTKGQIDEARRIIDIISKMNQGQGLDYAHGAFWLARVQLLERNYTQAISTLERGLEQMPSDSSAWILLGGARMAIGDLNNAERALQRAIELKPESPQAWQRLHQLHDLRQEHDAALADLQKAVRFSGGRNLDLYLSYLDYLSQHGDIKEAISAREDLARRMPDASSNRQSLASLYLRNGQPEKALAILNSLLEQGPDQMANIAAMAVYLASQGKFDEGSQMLLDHIHRLQSQSKDTSEDWLVLARFMRQSNRADQALSAYHAAIQKDESAELKATRELAEWLFSQRQFAQAVIEYERLLGAAKNDPSEQLVHWRRYIETLLNNGEIDKAGDELAKLLEKHPADAQSYLIKGVIAEQLMERPDVDAARRQQLGEQAETAYNQAVRYAPNIAAPYTQRARFRLSSPLERVQTLVRDDLRKAIELDPRAIAPRELLVQWNLNRGNPDEAIAEQERLVAANPTYARGLANLAELYLSDGKDLVKVAKLLDDAQKILPDLPAWHQYRARLYRLQRQPQQALNELAKAYELDSSLGRFVEYVGFLLVLSENNKALALLNEKSEEIDRVPLLQAMRGRALYKLGRTDDGLNAFGRSVQAALSGSPENMGMVISQIQATLSGPELLTFLEPLAREDSTHMLPIALAQLRLVQGQALEAIADLQAIGNPSSLDVPLRVEYHRLLARAYYEQNQFIEARRHYEAVLELNETDLVSLNNLAYLLADNLNELQAALALAQRAANLVGNVASQKANILDTLGWVQFRTGDQRAALESLEKSVRLEPMVPNHLHLAKVYIALDRPTAAQRELIAARRLAEESEDSLSLKEIDALLKELESSVKDSNEVTP